MAHYGGGWAERKDVEQAWPLPADAVVICARYDCPDYEGSADLVYAVGLQLFENTGSHCSCNGLEECWAPEQTTLSALRMRKDPVLHAALLEWVEQLWAVRVPPPQVDGPRAILIRH